MMLASKTFHDTTSWPYYPDLDFAERWLPWGTPETFVYSIIGISAGILCGWLLYLLCRPFVTVRSRRSAVILGVTLGGSAVMVIWIGDPNLLYTFPIFTALFMLTTRGDRVGRLAVCFIFFCMCMATAALFDTYLGARIISYVSDLIARIGRCVVFLIIYLCFRRFLPTEPPQLSRRLWSLVFALSLMPLAALASTVLLTYPRYESEDVVDLSLRIGLGILPFVLVMSIVLLAAIIVLARQQALEEAGYLASLRENYYENLRAQDQQLRQLRHDLRNHITAASGLLELGKVDEARAYLDDLGESRALGRPRRFCDNELANVVLAAKAEALEQSAIACDFSVELPTILAIADTDLCALLGNALDNAREAATGVAGAIVRLRCRADKGLFMLAVDNPIHGEIHADLSTTKPDKRAHGHGLPSMRSICERYGGTLETRIDDDGFHLLVCLSPANIGEQ